MTRPRKGFNLICQGCGEEFYVPHYRFATAKYCSRNCLAKIHLRQYVPIYGFKKTGKPPRRYKTIVVGTKQVREHRWVMEQHLGRKLATHEHVHHINGDWEENSEANVCMLCPNCHSLTETFGGLNRGRGRTWRYKKQESPA